MKIVLVQWALCRRELSVSVANGITSDCVIINEWVPFILYNKIKEKVICQ